MTRCIAFLFALFFAFISVSSACVAAPAEAVSFTLEPARSGGKIRATFRSSDRRPNDSNWSTGFAPGQLAGLDAAGFRATGHRPLRFAVIRDAGRLDCAGRGGSSRASGQCRFTPDGGFLQLLAERGIARPSRDQAFAMMAVDVRRELVSALAAARYPRPTPGQLITLTAVGVTPRYIADLARVGYRPGSLDRLVEFAALGITADYVGGFTRLGYANLPGDELVQLKALDISPAFVAGFDRAGYGRLPVDTLVQLKAMGISPEFAQATQRRLGHRPSVDQLVRMRLFGIRR